MHLTLKKKQPGRRKPISRCNLSVRNNSLPICPEWTQKWWRPRRDSNPRRPP
jgi:hypothetical protein